MLKSKDKSVLLAYQEIRYSTERDLPRMLVNEYPDDVANLFNEKLDIDIGSYLSVGFLVHLKFIQAKGYYKDSKVIEQYNLEVDKSGMTEHFLDYMNFVGSSIMTAKENNIDIGVGYSFGMANYICRLAQSEVENLGIQRKYDYNFISDLGKLIVSVYEIWSRKLGIKQTLFNSKLGENTTDTSLRPSNRAGIPIGGWLNLMAFGLVFGALTSSYYTYQSIMTFFTRDYEGLQYEIDNFTRNVIRQIDFYTMVVGIITFLSILLLNYLFFNRRKVFINFYIFFSAISVFVCFVDELLANMIEYTVYEHTIGVSIASLVWVTYLLRSRRVKDTFINVKKKYIKISQEEFEELKGDI